MKKGCAALLVGLWMSSVSAATADDVAENTRVVRRLYEELFSKWNLAVIDEIFSPEFLGHGMLPGTPRGPEGVRRFYAGIRAGLPDFRITVEDLFGAGDRVVVRWHATATHTGTFRGMPPTGARVSLDGIAIYRLVNGKAVERWVQVNMLDMIEQIRAAASSTARPMDASQLRVFGERYTAAWCSQNAANVAAFFSEAGSLQINGGAPSVGRAAITAAAQGFMTAFPDMVVTMDGVDLEGDRARYHWTLTGTNTGPGGTGKAVKISGYEEWRLGPDGLVAESKGHFDEADYKRQLSGETAGR